MSLLPISPKIIISALQLPENKQPFSPDPQNPWGPQLATIYIFLDTPPPQPHPTIEDEWGILV